MSITVILSLVGVLVALSLAAFLAYKNMHPAVTSVICVLIVIITSRLDMSSLITDYPQGASTMIVSMFLMFLLGAIFGQIYADTGAAASIARPLTKILKNDTSAIIGVILITGVMRIVGLSMGAFFIMYPIAVALFRKYKVHRNILAICLCFGAFTWAGLFPGNMNNYNVLCMKYLGTSSTAGFIPGLFGTIALVVGGTIYILWQNKSWKKKYPDYMNMWERDKDIPDLDDQTVDSKKNYPFLVAIIPTVVALVIFNGLGTDITIALLAGIACALVLFHRSLTLPEWIKAVSTGAANSYPGVMNLAVMSGLGYVLRLTPLYSYALEVISNSTLSPYLLIGIGANCISFMLASGTGSVSVIASTMTDLFTGWAAMGYDMGNLARILCFAACGLDTMPWGGSVISYTGFAKTNVKESYIPFFWTCAMGPILACFLVVIPLASLGFK